MSAGKPRDPRWVGLLDRVYAAALWLYPRAHRERWGAQMRQALRDRCRESARAGRGPLRMVLTEWLPDLAASAGRERLASFAGLAPIKRVLLIALLFAFAGSVILRGQIAHAMSAAGDAWKQYQQELDWRATKEHEAGLARATELAGTPHADVVAAQLYWAAGDGFRRSYPAASGLRLGSSDISASDALLDHADAALGRALDRDDPWALWLAAGANCPARPRVCNPASARARLIQVDPGNGAVWAMEMNRAHGTGDPARERAALARLAQSTTFDWHYADTMRGMLGAFGRKPLPQRLRQAYSDGSFATTGDSAILLAGAVGGMNGSLDAPAFGTLDRFCRPSEPGFDPERIADCGSAGRVLAERGTALIDQMVGYDLWLRAAAPSQRAQILGLARDAQWQEQQYARIDPATSASAARRWRDAWMAAANEREVVQHLLQQDGLPIRPPPAAEWKSRYDAPPR